MILSEIRTAIRDRLIGLQYDEWTGFSSDNLPDTVLERSFHVGVTGGSGSAINQAVLRLPSDVIVTLWIKGFNNPVEAQDAGLLSIQNVLCDLLGVEFRTLPSYRKIELSSYTLEPLAGDNDTICKVVINLTVETILEVTQIIT